jgi:Fur family transcriptional regulator, ferric uptake regulator
MKKARDAAQEFLRGSGLKLTRQRSDLLDAIFSSHRHFSAEELHRELDREGHRVSVATIYRSLSVLVEGGLLQRLDVGNGRVLYEHTYGQLHHDHMVCLDCGRITEFRSPEIEELQEKAARAHRFTTVAHSHKLYGYCSSCSKRHPEPEAIPVPGTRSGA